jgi:hypothetical protein
MLGVCISQWLHSAIKICTLHVQVTQQLQEQQQAAADQAASLEAEVSQLPS